MTAGGIPGRIAELRGMLGLSAKGFGHLIHYSQPQISLMERGLAPVSERAIRLICVTCQVNEAWLVTGEGQPFKGGTLMEKKSNLEQLAELLASLPREQQEFAAAHLLGVAQGMKLAADLGKEKKSA